MLAPPSDKDVLSSSYGGYDATKNYRFQFDMSLGDTEGAAFALNNLGAQALYERRYGQAIELLEKSLALAQQTDSKMIMAYSLHNLGDAARYQG
ncbi:MAG: tetratricopeptide repeat protein, partial [Deltaproteobacteria bacterium]